MFWVKSGSHESSIHEILSPPGWESSPSINHVIHSHVSARFHQACLPLISALASSSAGHFIITMSHFVLAIERNNLYPFLIYLFFILSSSRCLLGMMHLHPPPSSLLFFFFYLVNQPSSLPLLFLISPEGFSSSISSASASWVSQEG